MLIGFNKYGLFLGFFKMLFGRAPRPKQDGKLGSGFSLQVLAAHMELPGAAPGFPLQSLTRAWNYWVS